MLQPHIFVNHPGPHIGNHSAQEAVCEQKHSQALLVPIPPLTRLPILYQKDEALARTGC